MAKVPLRVPAPQTVVSSDMARAASWAASAPEWGWTVPPVRLSRRRIDALEAVLLVHMTPLTPRFITRIEGALTEYKDVSCDLKREVLREARVELKREEQASRALQAYLAALPAGDNADDRRRTAEHELRQTLERVASLRRGFAHRAHRPSDPFALELGVRVVAALDEAGVPLRNGRDTPLIDALRLVRRWADGIRGATPRTRKNLHTYAAVAIDVYRGTREWWDAANALTQPRRRFGCEDVAKKSPSFRKAHRSR